MWCAVHQERVSDRLEGQRQEQAIELYHTQADELDQWLTRKRSAVTSILELEPPEETDMEDQLTECQVRAPPAVHAEQWLQTCSLELLLKNINKF